MTIVDATKPVDGIPADKGDIRANWTAINTKFGELVSVKDYGALGRGGSLHRDWTSPLNGANETYAVVTSSTKTVVLRQEAGNSTRKHYFQSANVGDPIEIMYGGAPDGSELITWIISVNSSTEVTLAHQARATVSNVNVRVAKREQGLVNNFTSAGSMTLGSRTLTVTGASFDSYLHTGRYVRVSGAGAANLYTTIQTVTDKNTVVVTDSPNANLTHAAVTWGPDDGPAVRAAVAEIMSAGYGKLYFPAGVYKIVPTDWSTVSGDMTACVQFGDLSTHVQLRGVEIFGDGMANTTIVCRAFGDTNPTNDPPFHNWRGSGSEAYRAGGIRFMAKPNESGADNLCEGLHIHDLEIDGGCYPGNTGNTQVITNDLDCWESGGQGFSISTNFPVTNAVIERCYIHNFRGELIYGSGSVFDQFVIRDNRLGSSNGSLISVALGFSRIVHNVIYDGSGNGFEDSSRGTALYNGNIVYDCKNGMSIGQNQTAGGINPYATMSIVGNHCERIWANAIYFVGHRATITGNVVMDHAINGISISNGNVWVDDRFGILVSGNTVASPRYDGGGNGIGIDDTNGVLKATITGNFLGDGASSIGLNATYLGLLSRSGSEVRIWGNSIGRVYHDSFLYTNTGNKLSASQYMPTIVKDGDVRTTEGVSLTSQSITLTNADKSFSAKCEVLYFDCESGQIYLVPTIDDTSRYKQGHRLVARCKTDARPVKFPWRGTNFSCRCDRFVHSGVEVAFAWDVATTKFIETEYRDTRGESVTVTSGTAVAGKGAPTIILDFSGATTCTTHSGIPEGDWVQVIKAPDGNATLQNNSVIKTLSGSDLTLTTDVPTFWRNYGSVLYQVR